MELRRIETLLEKYLAGETSLDEETRLHDYFAQKDEIPDHLKEYRILFGFYQIERQKTSQQDLLLPKPRSYKWVTAVASVAAIVAALWMFQPFMGNQTTAGNNSQTAIQNTKGLFMIMGGAVKESQQSLDYLDELNALDITKKQNKDTLKTTDNTLKNNN